MSLPKSSSSEPLKGVAAGWVVVGAAQATKATETPIIVLSCRNCRRDMEKLLLTVPFPFFLTVKPTWIAALCYGILGRLLHLRVLNSFVHSRSLQLSSIAKNSARGVLNK
jgi:hypothetical protein